MSDPTFAPSDTAGAAPPGSGSAPSLGDGFVGLAGDVAGALDNLLRWSEVAPQKGKKSEEIGRVVFMRAVDIYDSLIAGEKSLNNEKKGLYGVGANIDSALNAEKVLVQEINHPNGEWYEASLYVIAGSKYFINCREQVWEDTSTSSLGGGYSRTKYSTESARKRVQVGDLWAAPLKVPGNMVTGKIAVQFSFTSGPQGQVQLRSQYPAGAEPSINSTATGSVYNPFEHGYNGLIGYFVPVDGKSVPGAKGYTVPSGWNNDKEYWKNDSRVLPSYPDVKPGEVPSCVPGQ
ncbi:hypothetical protein ABZ611_34540 [Streptomyces sp. NPDC007861]|uniref:hypothetical protein n=1 Tax=Streptomyces sp. NPDC007861 TaxID=3154893 RepID=UPI0033C13464